MYIVGIDIAKRKHEAAVIDGDGAVIIKPFSFTNNCSGYNRLLAMLAKAKLPLDEVSFAMEATGHYWLALFTRLQKEGFRVQVINPVQTNSIRSFYIYIHFPVLCEPSTPAEEKNPAKLSPQRCSKPLFNFSHKRPTFAFTPKTEYTLGSLRKIAHKGLHGETRAFSDEGGITTLGAFRTFTNIPGPGARTAYFAAFGP